MLLNKENTEPIEDGCEPCEEICELVDFKCFCKLSSFQISSFSDISSYINDANECLIELIGEDCFDRMCGNDQSFLPILDSRCFKNFYVALIEYYAICDGFGTYSKLGVHVKKSEDFYVSQKAQIRKEEKAKAKLENRQPKFLEKLKSYNLGCKCDEVKPDEKSGCGCTDSVPKGCGCDSCKTQTKKEGKVIGCIGIV